MAWNTPLSPERKQLLDELVEKDTSIATMKKVYGFGYATVRKHYPEYRAGKRNQYTDKPSEEVMRKLVRLVEEETPLTVISEVTGLPTGTIKRLAPNAGSSSEDVGIYAAAVRQLQEMGVEVK